MCSAEDACVRVCMCVGVCVCPSAFLVFCLAGFFFVTPHGNEQLKSTAANLTPSTLQALHNGRLSFICFWAVKTVP